MAITLPYVVSYGLVERVLEKIKEAQTPSRFTQDFLSTQLGMSSGSAMALIPLLKKMGFLGADGVPTEAYKKFRNQTVSKGVLATAIKDAYKELYARNEYAHKLPKDKLTELIKEITGVAQDSSVVRLIVGTYEILKKNADFEAVTAEPEQQPETQSRELQSAIGLNKLGDPKRAPADGTLGLNLSYTINLNLPATTDVAVFNAIFKSLKENLLQAHE